MNLSTILTTAFSSTIVLVASAGAVFACPGQKTIEDLTLGSNATALSDGFAEFACGTNGGPPSRPLRSFEDYLECPADERGFHEVYFRYDDEQEYRARALEQHRLLMMCQGTRIFGIPVIVSALFAADGVLEGLRIVSDARGSEPGDRADHWALGPMLRRQHPGDWACEAIPLSPGSTSVGTFAPDQTCTLSTVAANFMVRYQYYHRTGQSYIDEFDIIHPELFVSETYFEMTRTQ